MTRSAIQLSRLSLILGGAASGKSLFAETLVCAAAKTRHYIATARPVDAEMHAKIDLHQARRGAGWHTHETPTDIAPAIAKAGAGEVVLLDCASLWLSNTMATEAPLAAATEALVAALGNAAAPVVIVSNVVGSGIVPENALARRFREAQGLLNQRLAREAGFVALVTAGLPQVLKGTLPEGLS